MKGLVDPIRYAIRQFRQSPIFTITAVLTLALGIGGTTAIFTLMHTVMLRSLPVADPESLYRIGDGDNCCVQGSPQEKWGLVSYSLYQRLVEAAPEFEQVAAFQAAGPRLSVRREGADAAARPIRTEYATGTYFTTLGINAIGGRVFTSDDDRPGAEPVVVLSHHLWQGTYGGDSSVIGATFLIEGRPFTAIGVTPPEFYGETLRGDPPDIWIPLQQEALIAGSGSLVKSSFSAWLRVIGRLRPGASVDGMAPRLTGVLRQWIEHEANYPADWMANISRALPQQTIDVVPAGAGVAIMNAQYGRSLRLLLGVCGAVLLIACANVANLLLTRAVSRRQQVAVRLALGAARAHIVRQALLESVLLAMAGGLAGLAVASLAAKLLLSLAFANARYLPIDTSPSIPMLLLAFALALATGVVFGGAPAWLATRTHPVEALRGSGRTTGDRASKTRTALLVVQATLSVVLVAGAMLLARSLNRLQEQDFGYQVDGRVIVALNSPPADYSPDRLQALYRRIEEQLLQLPGVQGAGLALYNPLTNNWGEMILVAGHPPPAYGQSVGASWDRVSADYLQNFGIATVRGRAFTAADNEQSAPVAVVNEAFVKRFFRSDEDPIGQHFGLDLPENAGTYEIVGVVRDAKFAGFELNRPARPMLYVPLAQTVDYKNEMMKRLERLSHFVGGLMLVTRTPVGQLEPLIVRTLAAIDPNLTVNTVRTMRQQVELSFNQERAVATLAGLFGVVALLLAAIGLYGVTAYSVAQRTNEIGLRMALGANRGRVVGLVMRSAFARALAGLLLGLPLAIGAGRLVSAQLYEVPFWDPLALLTATAALALCALVAALAPAMRAAAISPMLALRGE